jgi:serine protease AprX
VLVRVSEESPDGERHVRSVGGTVVRRFKHVRVLVADVPLQTLSTLKALAGSGQVIEDVEIPGPGPVDPDLVLRGLLPPSDDARASGRAIDALPASTGEGLDDAHPVPYTISNAQINIQSLHAAGLLGQGVVVAVLDSGIRPGFPHISLDGSVVACEDFLNDGLGCVSSETEGHGTFAAGMISADAVMTLDPADPLRNAVLAYCPECFADPATHTRLPLIGSAPAASIYALRWFGGPTGGRASAVLAGMERAIDLKMAFDAGDPGGVNVQVLNASLGAYFTLFPGHQVVDEMIDAVLDADIVPVVSAGNSGPSGLTVSSPGWAYSALTVGASSEAALLRIQLDLLLGPGSGALRPSDGTQTAFFSSRGPVPDGRRDPDVVANGWANLGQGYGATTDEISLESGTSFSAPTVAGVVAVLRQAFPNASACQVQNAIVLSANRKLLDDGSKPADRGAGMVDARRAYELLGAGAEPDCRRPRQGSPIVAENIERATGQEVHRRPFAEHIRALRPGERTEIFYAITPDVRRLTVDVGKVTPLLPPEQQNQLVGDRLFLTIHDATSGAFPAGPNGWDTSYLTAGYTTGGRFSFENPDAGVVRITFVGGWTNAGRISADVQVSAEKERVPPPSASGSVRQDELRSYALNIPPGVKQADFRLEWRSDWGHYPTNDVDLWLLRPNNTYDFKGATLHSPERASIPDPAPGLWTVFVQGYEVNTRQDRFDLSVTLDGEVVRLN